MEKIFKDLKDFIEIIFLMIFTYTLSPIMFGGLLITEIIKQKAL